MSTCQTLHFKRSTGPRTRSKRVFVSASIASRANSIAVSFSGSGNSVGDLTVNEGLGSPLVVRKPWIKVVFLEMRSENSTKLETSKAMFKTLIQAHKNRGRDTRAACKTRCRCSHQLMCAHISSSSAVKSIREWSADIVCYAVTDYRQCTRQGDTLLRSFSL